MTEKDKEPARFYNVERTTRIIEGTRPKRPPTLLQRVLRQILTSLDSVTSLLVIPVFGVFILSVSLLPFVGVMYGTLAFLAAVTGLLASVGYAVHRMVGKHLIIVDQPLKTKLLAIPAGFLLALGLILVILFIARVF